MIPTNLPGSLDAGAFDELSNPEYTVGGVRFFIDLIPARQAAPIFRAILHELQHVDFEALAGGLEQSNGDDADLTRVGLQLIQQLTRIRPEFINWLESQMFRYVRFQSSSTTPHPLTDSEEIAFANLNVFDLHEVLVRSLARNFFGQFSVYRSRRSGGQPLPSGSP